MTDTDKKLSDWLGSHPDGYYSLPMNQIAKESGTSISAAARILPRLLAKTEDVMPSEIKHRRFLTTQNRIDREQLWSMHARGMSVTDIAFILDCNDGSVRDIIRKERPPSDLEQVAG